MADEQIIYLSPEEELTNVRERLERLPSKRIVLIIPQQTQLRSLVGWRLIHSRARELGKDILIISADRQIRSVVKAAGFKVADSLASTPSGGKSRPDGRSRTNTGGKSTPHLRGTTHRGPTKANAPTVSSGSPQPGQLAPSMPPIQSLQDYELETNKPRNSEPTTRGSTAPTSPSSSSTFGKRNRQFGPNYDFRVGEVPPIYPVAPPEEEDEDEADLWIEDVGHAQSLRDAAQQDANEMLPEQGMPPLTTEPPRSNAFREDMTYDPLAFLDEIPSSSLPEQRGSVMFDNLDEEMPDISDYPTGVILNSGIEDLGDQGSIVENPRSWADVMQEDEQGTQGPPRVHGIRPRSSRTGGMQSTPPEDFDAEDESPFIYDQPTRIQPPSAATGTGSRTYPVAQNEPRPVALPQNRSAQSPPSSSRTGQQKQQKSTPARSRQPVKTGAGRAGVGASQSDKKKAATPPKRTGREVGISIAIGILIFLIIGAVVYFVPSADVTIGVPFKNYSLNMTLLANTANTQNAASGTVAAQTLTYNASVSDKGPATGSISVGNSPATGSVTFTNKGSQTIEIPTGTQLSTASGVTFTTMVDVLVSPSNGTYTPPISVQAQNQGTIGNVAANTIVNITPEGVQLILQFNSNIVSTSVLTVTNPQSTTGGGAGKALALSPNDVNTLKAKLNDRLQAQLQGWLTKQLHVGDQAGKPVVVETVTTTPDVNNAVTGGTFSETLKMQATVLVVRSAALQSAVFAQINDSVSKNKLYSGYTLYQPQQLQITKLKNTPSKDGLSLKLSFTALGQVIPSVTVDQIRSLLAGKKVSEVQNTLSGSGVVSSSVAVYPNFFPWLPFLASHITVHIVPAPPATHPTPNAT